MLKTLCALTLVGAAGCGRPEAATAASPRLLAVPVGGRVSPQLVGVPPGRTMHVMAAEPPYALWKELTPEALRRGLETGAGSGLALQAVSADGGTELRTPLVFTGVRGWWQRRLDEPQELACGLSPLPAAISPADGSVVVRCELLGVGMSLYVASAPETAGRPVREAWTRTLSEVLLDTDPPCLWLPEGGLLAFERKGGTRDDAFAVVKPAGFGHGPVTATATIRPAADGLFETLVRLPGRTLSFVGPRWGAGGAIRPRSIQFTGIGGPLGDALTCRSREDETSVQWDYHRAGEPACSVTEHKSGSLLFEAHLEDGASWRLREVPLPEGGSSLLLEGSASSTAQPEILHRFEFDRAGALAAFAVAGRPRVALERDASGRVVAATVANGPEWRVDYDDPASTVRIDEPLRPGAMVAEFDASRRCTVLTRQGGHTVQREFDAHGRIVAESESEGVVRYVYADDGTVTLQSSRAAGAPSAAATPAGARAR